MSYKKIDVVMMSRFGNSDGGRETWANNFLPELEKTKNINVEVYGYKNCINDNKSSSFVSKFSNKFKFNTILVSNSIIPVFVQFIVKFPFFYKKKSDGENSIILAMGIFELISVTLTGRLKNKKVLFLRSIFLNEKGDRIPNIFNKLAKVIEGYVLSHADVILANGQDIKRYYELNYNVKVEVIENSVDLKKWEMPPPRLDSDRIKVSYIGRLSKVKGIDDYFDLIDAINIGNNAEKYEFHVVGSAGAYQERLIKAQAYNNFHYHGVIANAELSGFLSSVDVCVALTYSSNDLGGGGTSNALLEQMAANKIIVAWDNNIFRQLLNPKRAYLCKQYSVEGLLNALEDIRKKPELAINKSIEAKNFISKFKLSVQLEKFCDVVGLSNR
jgi:glycosyltransferase involved in cell wall biosynthesis